MLGQGGEDDPLLPRAGLIAPRTGNGYREFGGDDVRRLQFIHRARDAGFSIEEVRMILPCLCLDCRDDYWRDFGGMGARAQRPPSPAAWGTSK